MANSLPFNAVAVDGEYDRVYKAEDWAWYFATFIANGIFPKPSDGLQVVAYSGMEIRVNAGYAFINGYAFRNPATLSVTLDTAEGALNRVDRVVVRWDLPQRDMYIAVLKGTPSAKPTATAVTRTTEAAKCRSEYMSSNLLRVVQEQQETIEKQSRLIADLIATLESWEQTAGYDGEELKERAKDLQLRERQDL